MMVGDGSWWADKALASKLFADEILNMNTENDCLRYIKKTKLIRNSFIFLIIDSFFRLQRHWLLPAPTSTSTVASSDANIVELYSATIVECHWDYQ